MIKQWHHIEWLFVVHLGPCCNAALLHSLLGSVAELAFGRSHIPVVCIGMELSRVKQLKFAAQYLRRALVSCPQDPFVLNEMGVVLFEQKKCVLTESLFVGFLNSRARWKEAEELFARALSVSSDALDQQIRSSFTINHAHSLRKLRYDSYSAEVNGCIQAGQMLESFCLGDV